MIPISVIVPIYNMEKLMRRCLDSILAQSFQDYECILIDDGSTDGSPAICEEFATKDNRFKVFHKPNGGLSDARNYGLANAQGEYTIFFDPDDWVDPNCLKDMYAKAKETNADMVMCDLFYNDKYVQTYYKQEPTSLNHHDVLKDLITGKIYGFTVTKLIRRVLYQQYQLEYPKGMYGCEDQYTICALLKNELNTAYIPKAYYHYMHYGSETQSRRYDENTYQHDLKIRDMFVELLENTPYRDLVYSKKTASILYRAFCYGNKIYSSKQFKYQFGQFRPFTKDLSPSYFIFFLNCSLLGNYHFFHWVWTLLFNIKQMHKRLSSLCK